MKKFSPPGEAKRLASLRKYDVLDTPPEAAYDDLTLLASQLCGMPISLMSLIEEERQWFKSKVGIEIEETSRDVSFCAHAIRAPGVLVVPDALRDARFRENPLVLGAPHIRFYAGAPLIAPDGSNLGALCVIDDKPRDLTPQQIAALEALSRQAVAQLELRHALKTSRESLHLAEESNAALHKSLATNRALLGAIPDLMLRIDGNGVITDAGPPGRIWKDLRLRKCRDLSAAFSPHTAQRLMQAQHNAQQTGAMQDLEFSLGDASRTLDYEARIVPLPCNETLLLLRDITQRKAVDRMKNEFISTVSHELRTPLTSIRGALGLMKGGAAGALPERAQSMTQIAYHNSERLIRLINAILDIEKLESGKMVLQLGALDLGESVAGALESNRAYGEELGVRFELRIAAASTRAEKFTVLADADRLAQVLTNLLGNAAKFSAHGRTEIAPIQVVLERVGEAGEEWYRVSICDGGPGIAESFRARVFGRFAQGDSSDARPVGGTGLGLNISKTIIEKLGGRIGFYNNDEREAGAAGATFYFELPALDETARVKTV